MMRTCFYVASTALALTLAAGAYAAESKAKPTETKQEVSPEVMAAAEQTSGLFYSVCAGSAGNKAEFDKGMKALVQAKAFAKLKPEEVKTALNAEEAKNAYGTKGFGDEKKVILVAYDPALNLCSMRVSDVQPNQLRHAFQADLKKALDKNKGGKVKVYKPKTNGAVSIYAADIMVGGKTQQYGIAISNKAGESLLTYRQ
jgi:hypothetical protein